uniref:Methyltransferase domain-containing protein n=1 Tax=Chlamydomonas euryale TaxID=1486919 RepID=A0A7R9V8G6_9CHLO|mmetsp:Transcript_24091/g.71500  ORF Transcript_24091/g.71500 Transcript_24091/m.71500 type:complete len:259 (+) Transcript_24091:304-1080(+)
MVAYDSAALWDARVSSSRGDGEGDGRGNAPDTDWFCGYDKLLPLISHVLERPRCAVLCIGTGTSTFPEQVYDKGAKQVVVVDASAAAMDAVRSRNAEARTGLTVLCGDVAAQPFPLLPQPTQRFDLVVDKGTVDCLLGARDGWRAAERALRELYERMRTPGTLLLVSHSPPHERMDMLASVPHWHDVQFKMVTATSLDKLVTGAEYTEELSDYPYAVEGWEHMQAARLGLKPEELPRRPADAGIEFAPGTAYVYLLER